MLDLWSGVVFKMGIERPRHREPPGPQGSGGFSIADLFRSIVPGMVTPSGDLIVLAIQRQGKDLTTGEPLAPGDTMLLQGTWEAMETRLEPAEVLVVDSPELVRRQALPMGPGSKTVLAALAIMVLLLATGLVPPAVAGLLAAGIILVSGVLSVEQIYRAINWTTVILVAALMPLSTAMQETGGAALLADGRVRLVAFPHCSNVVGAINPVTEICAMARAAGARTVVDGVSYAPHGLPDFPALGADVYLFSAYKTYGPHQGIMLMTRDFAEELPAQGHWFNAGALYKRFTPAGPDHAQIAACAGIADYIDTLHGHHFDPSPAPAARNRAVHDLMRAHEVEVTAPLLDFLAHRNALRLIGPADPSTRAPTVAVALDRPADPVAAELAQHGIACWGGDFYARRPLEAMGVDLSKGVLRLSLVHYTTADEVSQLIAALEKVL